MPSATLQKLIHEFRTKLDAQSDMILAFERESTESENDEVPAQLANRIRKVLLRKIKGLRSFLDSKEAAVHTLARSEGAGASNSGNGNAPGGGLTPAEQDRAEEAAQRAAARRRQAAEGRSLREEERRTNVVVRDAHLRALAD